MHNVLLLIELDWMMGGALELRLEAGRVLPRNGDGDRHALAFWLRHRSTDSFLALAIDR
jgi:hypothetical protein